MPHVRLLRHALHHIFCQIKGPYTIFLVYFPFLITFSGLLRHNYITLYIFWKTEVGRFQTWQNLIEKFKWGRIRSIRVWRIWSHFKELFSSFYYKYFLKDSFSIDGSYYCLTRIHRKIFLVASLIRYGSKCWFWDFFQAISVYKLL